MKTKKTMSLILSFIMAVILIPKMNVSVFASGYDAQKVVSTALSYLGRTDQGTGVCLRFVNKMFTEAYGYGYESGSTRCCAYKYGSQHIKSTSRDNIPIGADVFFSGSKTTCSTCSNKAGHVGIYVGDGYIVHLYGGKVVKTTIDYVLNTQGYNYKYIGWGWHSNIALGDVSTNPDDYSFPNRDLYYRATVFRGSDVGWIQAVLYQCGYSINIDSSFGPATKTVVEQFQRDNGLTADGSVGPATREKLKQKWEAKKQSNVTLSSIAVAANPKKTSYLIGEDLDLTGLTPYALT